MGRLRLAAIIAPAAFAAALLVGTAVFKGDIPLPLLIGVGVLASTAAATLFAGIVFDVVERSEASLVESNEQLAALRIAAMSIAEEYELGQLYCCSDLSKSAANSPVPGTQRYHSWDPMDSLRSSSPRASRTKRGSESVISRSEDALLGAIIHAGALRLDDMSKDPPIRRLPALSPADAKHPRRAVKARRGTLVNLKCLAIAQAGD